MDLPLHVTVTSIAIVTDGGTVALETKDERDRKHIVKLTRHITPRFDPSQGEVTGRLYFDGELVTMRSADETAILKLLREARAQETDEINHSFVTRIITFVESEEYLLFADRLMRAAEQATDKTLYTVWIAHNSENRNRAIVRLGQIDGMGVRRAREWIDTARPLAQHIPASDVSKVAQKYLDAGLQVCVEPPFRWRLD